MSRGQHTGPRRTLENMEQASGGGGGSGTVTSVTAGAGMTSSGTATDPVLNVIANADGSIIVAADDVKVGVLATDAQHGNRGNGSLHTVADASNAGFMAAADFAKLGNISTLGGLFFGLGLDGDITYSSNTTQTTNLYPDHLTVNGGARLAQANYGIFAKTSVTVTANSFISNNGSSASGATGGATTPLGAIYPAIAAGSNGGTGAGANGGTGNLGGTAGNGGASSGAAGGNAGAKTAPAANRGGAGIHSIPYFGLINQAGYAGAATTALVAHGCGGGAGGGETTHSGGGGGCGGGGCLVSAPTITVDSGSFIEANGGNGGTPPVGDCGGGGAGGGGNVYANARVYAIAGALRCLGGSKGLLVGGSGAANGADGSVGAVYQYQA